MDQKVSDKPPDFDPNENYVDYCCWSNDTGHSLARAFISKHDLEDEYDRYLNRAAYDELVESGHFDEEDDE